MASIGSGMAKAQFSRERSTIYRFGTCNYSGLLASKKRIFLCPSRMDRSFVFSAISIRQQSQRSFAHPNFLTKECHRRTNAINQDSIDNQSSHMEEPKIIEESGQKNDTLPADDLSQGKKRSAKIHDFCFGIPFGGIVLGAGVVGFLLSGNRATLLNGLLFGGALLALSSYSLKVWRQGKSCLPFILGQSVLAVALLVKQFQIYALTKNLFPSGLYIITRNAVLLFVCLAVWWKPASKEVEGGKQHVFLIHILRMVAHEAFIKLSYSCGKLLIYMSCFWHLLISYWNSTTMCNCGSELPDVYAAFLLV